MAMPLLNRTQRPRTGKMLATSSRVQLVGSTLNIPFVKSCGRNRKVSDVGLNSSTAKGNVAFIRPNALGTLPPPVQLQACDRGDHVAPPALVRATTWPVS